MRTGRLTTLSHRPGPSVMVEPFLALERLSWSKTSSPAWFFLPRMVRPQVNVVSYKIDAMLSDPAQALEPFRSYLEVLARVHLDPRLRGKLDAADVVQQALLRAYAAWPEMNNRDQPVLTAWLRRILARTLADVVKHYDRDKRAV